MFSRLIYDYLQKDQVLPIILILLYPITNYRFISYSYAYHLSHLSNCGVCTSVIITTLPTSPVIIMQQVAGAAYQPVVGRGVLSYVKPLKYRYGLVCIRHTPKAIQFIIPPSVAFQNNQKKKNSFCSLGAIVSSWLLMSVY